MAAPPSSPFAVNGSRTNVAFPPLFTFIPGHYTRDRDVRASGDLTFAGSMNKLVLDCMLHQRRSVLPDGIDDFHGVASLPNAGWSARERPCHTTPGRLTHASRNVTRSTGLGFASPPRATFHPPPPPPWGWAAHSPLNTSPTGQHGATYPSAAEQVPCVINRDQRPRPAHARAAVDGDGCCLAVRQLDPLHVIEHGQRLVGEERPVPLRHAVVFPASQEEVVHGALGPALLHQEL